MRGTRKNSLYFEKYLYAQNYGASGCVEDIEAGTLTDVQLGRIVGHLSDLKIGQVVASYSAEMDKEALSSLMNEFLAMAREFEFTLSNRYVQTLWLLSIGYLLDIPAPEMEILKKLIQQNGFNDYLMDTLLAAIFEDFESENTHFYFDKPIYSFDDPYVKLKPVLDARENAEISEIAEYLNKYWYKGHSSSAWHNTHKKGLSYAGYWSFESAALVKLFGLDDSSLQGVDYYPYDMAHFDDLV